MDWYSGLLDANLISRILLNLSGSRTANAAADLLRVKKHEAEEALHAQSRTQAQHDVLSCGCADCEATRNRILEDHRRSLQREAEEAPQVEARTHAQHRRLLSGNPPPNPTQVRRPKVCAICRKEPPEPGLLTCRSCHNK